MRAMVYRGPYKVRMEEKDRPEIEHPNDAIVRVQLAAICGSDLHLYHDGSSPRRPGRSRSTCCRTGRCPEQRRSQRDRSRAVRRIRSGRPRHS